VLSSKKRRRQRLRRVFDYRIELSTRVHLVRVVTHASGQPSLLTFAMHAYISLIGRLQSGDAMEHAVDSSRQLEFSTRRKGDGSCLVLPSRNSNVFELHLQHCSLTAPPNVPTVVIVHYIGDLVTSDSDIAAQLTDGKYALLQKVCDFASSNPSITVILFLDTACYRITSSKKSLKLDAVSALLQPATKARVMVLWPVGSTSATALVRDHDDDDDDGGDQSGSGRPDVITACSALAVALDRAGLPASGGAAALCDALCTSANDALEQADVPATLHGTVSNALRDSVLGISLEPTTQPLTRWRLPTGPTEIHTRDVLVPHGATGEAETLRLQLQAERARRQEAEDEVAAMKAMPSPTVAAPATAASAPTAAAVVASPAPPDDSRQLNVAAAPFQPGVPAHAPRPFGASHTMPTLASTPTAPATVPAPLASSPYSMMPSLAGIPAQYGLSGRKGVHHCEVCKCDVFGDQNWALHITSEKHRRKELLSNADLAGKLLDPTTTALLVNPQNFFKCDVCNVVVSGHANIQQHLAGQQHKKNDALSRGVPYHEPQAAGPFSTAPGVFTDDHGGRLFARPTENINPSRDPVWHPNPAPQCLKCNVQFSSNEAMEQHLLTFHPPEVRWPASFLETQ
jgi:hypothetical protein